MNTQSNGMRVLLVTADAAMGATLARGLLQQNVDVVIERGLAEAKDRAFTQAFDALVVDGTLLGAAELCRSLRRLGAVVPTIMLIDAESATDRLRARAFDADAYIRKPVAMPELLSELRAGQASRSVNVPPDRVTVADLVIDMRLRAVYRDGRRIDLTMKESALLEILARRVGTLVDRATIVAHVWGEHTSPANNVLEVLVRRLRQKLDGGQGSSLIQTQRGRGYRLADPRGAEGRASAQVEAQHGLAQ